MEKRIEYQGMTSQQSDYVCPDGDMKLAVNAEYRDGGWKAVKEVNEKKYKGELLYIFKSSNGGKYLFVKETNSLSIYSETEQENTKQKITFGEYSDICNFYNYGNIISFTLDEKFKFLIFTESTEEFLFIDGIPPFINFEFRAVRQNMSNPKWVFGTENLQDNGSTNGNSFSSFSEAGCNLVSVFNQTTNRDTLNIFSSTTYSRPKIDTLSAIYDNNKNYNENQTNFSTLENFVFAGLGIIRKRIEKDKLFMFPVVLRYATRLYDGSYINVSPPILIFPSYDTPTLRLQYSPENLSNGIWNINFKISDVEIKYEAYEIEFKYDNALEEKGTTKLNNLEYYGRIVKSIDFFLSKPLYSIDTDRLCLNWDTDNNIYKPGFSRRNLEDDIKSLSSFYKVSSIDFKDLYDGTVTKWKSIFHYNGDIENYTQREAIDDFSFLGNNLNAGCVFNLNSRQIISQVKCNTISTLDIGIEAPLVNDCTGGKNPENNYNIDEKSFAQKINNRYFTIKDSQQRTFNYFADFVFNLGTKEKTKIAEYICRTVIKCDQGKIRIPIFLSIDSANSDYLIIVEENYKNEKNFSSKQCKFIKLQNHDLLQNSFNFDISRKLGASLDYGKEGKNIISDFNEAKFHHGIIYESMPNNPFVYKGLNSIELKGEIINFSTNNLSISQGQFGQYPLYAFCTDGVYSIGIGADGTLQNCVPLSYDILTDKHSVGKMEQIVVFATREGIIALSGSERKVLLSADKEADYQYDNDKQEKFITDTVNNVVVITPPQMTDLYTYFTTGVRFAFDANHGRLIAFNPAYDYSYIMDAKTNNWSVFYKGFDSVLNIPEQCLLVRKETNEDGKTEYNVYDYSSDDVVDIQKSYFITRPFKLDMPDVHKSIQSIIQRGVFCDRKDVQQALYGSNDLYNWTPVWSSKDIYLRGMRGSGYKYYKLAIFIPKFKQDEILHGCSVEFTPRLTNKPR